MRSLHRLILLPDEILAHVLSLMPTKFALRSSILSKRWRYTWTFVTSLQFYEVSPSCDDAGFPELVHHVLKLCKASQINLFRLRLPYNITVAQTPSVSDWIDKAVRLNARELEETSFTMCKREWPLSFFTCNALTKLKITNQIWEYPFPVHLPFLKIIIFSHRSHPIHHAFKLISRCPMLESLSLIVSPSNNAKDCTLNIPTLKRLELTSDCCEPNIRVVLNAPNLEYLFLGGFLFRSCVMEDVSSLVGASILAHDTSTDHVWAELLKGVKGVKSLSLRNISSPSLLPIFPNLKAWS